MSPEVFVDILSDALWLVILIVSMAIIPSLIVGLIVSIFQAATSINEQTLSFLPRLIVTLLALMYGGHWLTQTIMDYTEKLYMSIPTVVS
ncbi:MAG TPA: flagellar biosynthesis protein FliQ [Rheinheimera sp.]|uniref:flagellar biosynthesis protein FliQ n=1 Tax=Rheinheimera sp. TaxID=1869214 RepID=UPI002B49EA11|nr:flagellar biosynthesis protein FliQ [Rheinheimera sp.]HJS16697.1 flagellar biosynthesis protein FliQ [Rheinheimera sp.]